MRMGFMHTQPSESVSSSSSGNARLGPLCVRWLSFTAIDSLGMEMPFVYGVDDVDAHNPFGSSPRANMDELFADLTNHDNEPEHVEEISHANEALEALKSAQACGSRTGSISEPGNNGTNGDSDLHQNASHHGDNEHQNGGGLGEEYLS